MSKFLAALRAAYRFKPARTFAQALIPAIGTSTIFHVDWGLTLGTAATAGLLSFLQIASEGGDLLADDARVTKTKPTPPGPQLPGEG
jgi:hypothetical protein